MNTHPLSSEFWGPIARLHIYSCYVPVGGSFLEVNEFELEMEWFWIGVKEDISGGRNSAGNGVGWGYTRAEEGMEEGEAAFWVSFWVSREITLLSS